MGKGIIITIAALVVVAGGAAFYVYNKNSNTPGAAFDTAIVNESDSVQPKSLRDFFGLTINQTCTFNDTESKSNGTVYVANGRMRGDFTVESEEVKMTSHMITDSEDVYLWFDNTEEGYKMKISDQEEYSDTDEDNKSVDLDKRVDYKCSNWIVNDSFFQLPAGKNFRDLSAMMEETKTMMEDAGTAQCDACNSLPDSAKAQCLQALNCD
jgi:hypothetical protein